MGGIAGICFREGKNFLNGSVATFLVDDASAEADANERDERWWFSGIGGVFRGSGATPPAT